MVSQTKYCCSLEVRRFGPSKFWAGYAPNWWGLRSTALPKHLKNAQVGMGVVRGNRGGRQGPWIFTFSAKKVVFAV